MSPAKRSPEAAPPRRLLPTLFAGVFMAALDTAVIAPALPALREAFAIGHRQAALLMVVFILCSLCSTALLAHLGDRHGRRPVFLGSIGCFAAGSLLIALSSSFAMVLAGRAVQGLGAGGILPTASALIGDAVPPRQRGRALGLIGATYGMAFVLGPPLATLLMLVAGWPWIFLLNLPIAALVLGLGLRSLPRRATAAAPPPDLPGLGLTLLLLVCLVLGITRSADDLLGLRLWPGLLATAAAALALLIRVERRAPAPLIPLSLFGRRQLALGYLLSAASGFAMGSIVFLSSMAQHAHTLEARHAGLVLLPLVLSSMFGSIGAGRLLDRLGPRTLLLAGFALLALGYAASAVSATALWLLLLATAPVGLGIGIVVGGALRAIAIDEAPPAQRGAAQGLINICTSVGTLLAAATVGAVADFSGSFAVAYLGVALLMLLMLPAALALRQRGSVPFAAPAAG
jgi:MFS family permease